MFTTSWPRRAHARALVASAIAVLVVTAPPASGQATTTTEGPGEATTTTAPADPGAAPDPSGTAAPGTAVPGDPATTTTSTSTTVPDPLGGSSEGLSQGAYGSQLPFDLSSMAVLGSEVKRSAKELAAAQRRYGEAQAAIDATVGEFQRLAKQIDVVGVEREGRVADASAAKASLRRRAVEAYVRGDSASNLLSVVGDPVDYSRAKSYLETLADLDRRAVVGYQQSIAGLDDAERDLVDDQAALQQRVASLTAERDVALGVLLDARRCSEAYRRGSHACPPTFTFPVLGDVTFIDSWGAPRLPGSPDQHWHEGTDVMAPQGREIVAVEDGTLFKVGDQGLGGLRLWLHGASGIDYYYAHFSSFAPGIADGVAVTAGTVVGFAGNTGDAAGGPSHLHFEIHPSGGAPVDPYPLLKVAWGTRTMPLQSTVMAAVPSVVGTLPDEER